MKMAELTWKVVNDIRDFQRLEGKWNDLLEACPQHTIFQTWEWQCTWLEVYAKDPCVFLFYKEDELIAILPFFREERIFFSILRFVGTPDSDYLDFIIKRGLEKEVLFAFFKEIIGPDRSIGIIELDSINETSPVYSLMHEVALNDFSIAFSEKICPFITLPQTWDEYLESLSAAGRYFIRRKERKLFKDFWVNTGFANTQEDFEKRMDDFIRQHQKRWQSRKIPGAFARSLFKEFQLKAGKKLYQRGYVRLYFLEIEGRPAASYYLFYYRNSLYFYLGGFDPEYGRYSPGVVLMGEAIKDAIREGMNEFDLMRGNEAYKFKWSQQNRINHNFVITRKTPIVRLYNLLNWVVMRPARWVKRKTSFRFKSILKRIFSDRPHRDLQT